MANKSKFLPDSVSGALKGLVARVLGGCVFVFGIAATFALVFYNSYLDGWLGLLSMGSGQLQVFSCCCVLRDGDWRV